MELRDYLRGIRRHWLAILLMTLVGLGVGVRLDAHSDPGLRSDGRAVSSDAADAMTTRTIASLGDTLRQQKVPTYLEMASWQDVADGAIDALGLQTRAAQVVVRGSRSTNPDEHGDHPGHRARRLTRGCALRSPRRGSSSLAAAIDDDRGDGTRDSPPLTIYPCDPPRSLPTTPVFPDRVRPRSSSAVCSAGFGIAFALIRTVSDRRIRAADDVEARTGVPVVGHDPVADGARRRAAGSSMPASAEQKGSGFAVSEALRSLRTNLQFMDVDNPPRTIVVTSPLPERRQVDDRLQPRAHARRERQAGRPRRRRPASLDGRQDHGSARAAPASVTCCPAGPSSPTCCSARPAAPNLFVLDRGQRSAEPERGARVGAHAQAHRRPRRARNGHHRRAAAAAGHGRRRADASGRRRDPRRQPRQDDLRPRSRSPSTRCARPAAARSASCSTRRRCRGADASAVLVRVPPRVRHRSEAAPERSSSRSERIQSRWSVPAAPSADRRR